MNILAIVGTSHLTEQEEYNANYLISMILDLEQPDIVISGGANGIDTVSKKVARTMNKEFEEYLPTQPYWAGYKERNIIIAKMCKRLYCITTKIKEKKCYHCNADHERTGGCWTMRYAKILGKYTKLIVLI